MIINKLTLGHFGKFHNEEVEFDCKINVIYGNNEAGKSTMHSFIKGMFFGIEKGRGRAAKESLYDRYLPWDSPGTYQGSMEFTYNDIPYRISRSFYQKEKSFTMIRKDTGREVLSGEDALESLIPNFSESCFRNTISIRQSKTETDEELAGEVQNYIANLSTAKNSEVNVGEALAELTVKRKEYEAAINSIGLDSIEERIEKCLFNEDMLDRLHLKKKMLNQKLEQMKKQHELEIKDNSLLTEQELKGLYEIRSSASEYDSLTDSHDDLSYKEKEIEADIKRIGNELASLSNIKEHLNEASGILDEKRAAAAEIERLEAMTENEAVKLKKRKGIIKRACISGVLFILVSIISIYLMTVMHIGTAGIAGVSIVLAVLLASAGIVSLMGGRLWKKSSMRLRKYSEEIKIRKAETDSLTAEYENMLRPYRCQSLDELNSLYEKTAELKARKAFLEERRTELEEEADERKRQAEEIWEEIINDLGEYGDYGDELGDGRDVSLLVSELISDNERLKEEHGAKRRSFELEYESEAQAAKVIENEILKFDNEKDNLYELREQYEEEKAKKQQLTKELDAVKLAAETIKRLSGEIHDSFGANLNIAISKLAGDITLSSYTEAAADEKLSIKVYNGMKYVDLNKLSTGTIEQVYLALRLSAAELLFKEEMPLILDDSFANYDNGRLEAVLKLMHDMDRQILLFTCHDREQRILDECNIPYKPIII